MGESADNGREMTPKAAAAFHAYVGLGPGRSLRWLARLLAEQGQYKSGTAALPTLNTWSVKYAWQARLSAAITAQTEDLLAKAAEIDGRSFLRTSELVADRLAWADAGHVDAVIKMRETVRKPEPRGATTNVNVQIGATLRLIVERVAAEQGLSQAEVMAEAESILAGG